MKEQFTLETGLYDGVEREWYVWLCSSYIWGRDNELLYYLGDHAVFSDEKRLGQLTELAEYMNAILVIPMPVKTGWNTMGLAEYPDDISFLNQQYKDLTDWLADGYSTLSAKRYLFAQGGAGAVAALWLAYSPQNFTAAYYSQVPSFSCSVKPLLLDFDSGVPVFVNGSPLPEDQFPLSYWKLAGRIDRREALDAPFPVTAWTSSQTESHVVWHAPTFLEETAPFFRSLYDNFFDRYRRWRYNRDTGIVARSPSCEEMQIDLWQETVEGVERSWFAHIPQGDPPPEGYPVVIAYHGMKTDGKYYLEQSEWHDVAIRHRFVLLAPQGHHNAWNADENPNRPDDCKFTLALLDWLKGKTNVCDSRLFLVGFSLGGAMVHRLVMSYPFLFAGVCAKSGQLYDTNNLYDSVRESGQVVYRLQRTDLPVAMWQIMGEDENFDEYMGDEHISTDFWLKAAHASQIPTEYLTLVDRYPTRIYRGALTDYWYSYIRNIGHACFPGEAELVWSEFFSRLERPAIAVDNLRADRRPDGSIHVAWNPPSGGETVKAYLVTSWNGKQFPEQIVAGDAVCTDIPALPLEVEARIMVIPLCANNLSSEYRIVTV